jgi:hypothetical protein
MPDIPFPLPNSASPTGAGAVPQTPVQTAIARAAAATGVDFTFLLAQARLESGLDPVAQARTSSARGLYQFTGSTWMTMLGRHGADLGFDPAGVAQGPATRAQWLALRDDPQVAAMMAGELASDNRNYLYGVLGREPDHAELYLAHFLGPDGSARFLSALSADPSQSAAALLPKAAAANHAIFFAGSTPRSVGAVMDLLRNRIETAMSGGPAPSVPMAAGGGILPLAANPVGPQPSGGPIAREFAAAAQGAPPSGRASMADTLQSAFGLADAGDSSVPATVRAAYGRIRALGM